MQNIPEDENLLGHRTFLFALGSFKADFTALSSQIKREV
jgi:hypothetical protein